VHSMRWLVGSIVLLPSLVKAMKNYNMPLRNCWSL